MVRRYMSGLFGSSWRHLKDNRSVRFAIYVALGAIIYLSMLSNVMPKTLDAELFSVAKQDILSPVTVVDQEATDEKRAEAAAAVPSEYTFKQQAALVQIEKAGAVFDAANEIVRPGSEEDDSGQAGDADTQQAVKSVSERTELLEETLSGDLAESLSRTTLRTLVRATPHELDIAKEVTTTTVNNVMSEQIKWNELQKAKSKVADKVPSSSLNEEMEQAVVQVAKAAIVPNYVFDAEGTKQARAEAEEAVEPVVIREGQILAKKGQVINHEVHHQLQVVGLLDDKFNPYPYIGLALFVLMLTGLLVYHLHMLASDRRGRNTNLLIYTMVLSISLLFMKITSLLEPLGIHGMAFIVPAAVGAMLAKMLINERIALITSVVLALCGSLIFNVDTPGTLNFSLGIYILFSSLAGTLFLEKRNARPKILQTGLFVSLVNMAVVAVFLMIRASQWTPLDIGFELGFAFLSGFIAAVLTLGLMPLFEATFGILSTMRLIELSNPNHPLLRKILTEAPGTYHHSVMVANLAEGACESIGANGLLARVAAYYHDIGKTKRPNFFIENQMNIANPHDKISPQLSRTVILSHPYDGAEMLRAHRMPKEIVDIAEQHHGTTLLTYFYRKALANDENNVREEEFRYPGPKVQTREAAVIEVADSVEAATRSLTKPTPEKIDALIRKIINDRLQDGQFDECHLTLKDLDNVRRSMCETMKGIFHSRIEYPEVDLKKKVSHGS